MTGTLTQIYINGLYWKHLYVDCERLYLVASRLSGAVDVYDKCPAYDENIVMKKVLFEPQTFMSRRGKKIVIFEADDPDLYIDTFTGRLCARVEPKDSY